MFSLKDRVALVTGASQGIGRATALALAQAGARVAAAARNAEKVAGVVAEITAAGGDGLAATHGRCMGVGASGFLLGGGIGFAMRDRGLGCDLVQEIEVALPDGQVVRTSDNENADLFWALRGGGGGNLGVALRFTLRAVTASP